MEETIELDDDVFPGEIRIPNHGHVVLLVEKHLPNLDARVETVRETVRQ